MPPSKRLSDDCFLHDKDRLRHSEALQILRSRLRPIAGFETVPLSRAHGRLLAEPIVSPRDVPLSDNAAVDGYAFRHADHAATGGTFRLEGRAAAGHPSGSALAPGTAVRIFTGAVMPEGADTVAMQEDCTVSDSGGVRVVTIPAGLKPGANRRRAGEDLARGTQLLSPGSVLRPQDLAAIASTGQASVRVYRRLSVGLISSGDEIVRPGAHLDPGQVYDSNHFLLRALAETAGADVADLGILSDRATNVEAAVAGAAARFDVLVSTGGASRGEEDHMRDVLDRLGTRHMWQLAIKPGRPMMFGQIGDCVMLGLPGNPVAAMVCFLLYVRPVLTLLGGGVYTEPRRFQVPAAFEVPKKKPDRREFYRGILKTDEAGRTVVDKFPRDGSGLISGLREADGLIEIPEEATSVARGELVDFLPFSDFGVPVR